MSNLEYDRLYEELQDLETRTGVVLSGSPTVSVGYEAVDELPNPCRNLIVQLAHRTTAEISGILIPGFHILNAAVDLLTKSCRIWRPGRAWCSRAVPR